jgi:hypothetical protein
VRSFLPKKAPISFQPVRRRFDGVGFGLSYAGQIAPDARENTVRADFRLAF